MFAASPFELTMDFPRWFVNGESNTHILLVLGLARASARSVPPQQGVNENVGHRDRRAKPRILPQHSSNCARAGDRPNLGLRKIPREVHPREPANVVSAIQSRRLAVVDREHSAVLGYQGILAKSHFLCLMFSHLRSECPARR